jgi:P-type Ca2+ transporter type 2C
LILLPVHIAFLHLIIDPACSVVFEAEAPESNIMRRPPRHPDEPILNRRTCGISVLQGGSILVAVLVVYTLARAGQDTEGAARAMAFTTLILANLSLIVTHRSTSKSFLALLLNSSLSLRWVIFGTLAFLGAALFLPPMQSVFHFELPHWGELVISALIGVSSILWFELLKKAN